MFEHFTDHAKRALQLEGLEAQRMHHTYLGTEHLLLGLVREREGHGHRVLEKLGLKLRDVRRTVQDVVQEGPDVPLAESLAQTEHFRHVIRNAIEEARQLNSGEVGTEHLLLALLAEEDGVALRVLGSLGVKPEAARDELLAMLEAEKAGSGQA